MLVMMWIETTIEWLTDDVSVSNLLNKFTIKLRKLIISINSDNIVSLHARQ